MKTYRLTPGTAGLYDVGAIHAIDYPADARFVRVTGTDLEAVERLKFDTARGKAEVIVSKQRHGPTGTVTLHFEGATTKFSNYVAEDHLPDGY